MGRQTGRQVLSGLVVVVADPGGGDVSGGLCHEGCRRRTLHSHTPLWPAVIRPGYSYKQQQQDNTTGAAHTKSPLLASLFLEL